MIYVLYLFVAVGVTLLSIKAADYVDWIDKKTELSGAFIGGIMLSAVTSLPELFTSISSTAMLNEPGLCIGNILGSDLFNITLLAVLILIFFKGFSAADIAKSHMVVLGVTFAAYIAIILNMLGILKFEVMTVSITSIILAVCYVVSLKFLSGEEGEADESADEIALSLKQIVVRFVVVSIGIIVLSIMLSYVTDHVSDKLHLGKGIAGALFMGIATSLPELASSIALFRKGNYDIAVGNIVGSNVFNFAILALTDLVYVKGGLYDFGDPKTVNLLVFGAIATPLLFMTLKGKNRALRVITLVGSVSCYACFLGV